MQRFVASPVMALRVNEDSTLMIDDAIDTKAGLPEPVRDHLGQQLRSIMTVGQEKPRFLGDDPAPDDTFAPQLQRLETRLKTHEEGTGAVEHALDRILDAFGVSPYDEKPTA